MTRLAGILTIGRGELPFASTYSVNYTAATRDYQGKWSKEPWFILTDLEIW